MRSLDADIPLYNVMSLDRSIKDARWNGRFSNIIANITGILAVLLSAVGIFALTAHAVVCMTAEIGIRTALGAGAPQILWKVLRRSAIQVLLGIAAGVGLAMAWAQVLSPVNGITPVDFLAGAIALSLVSLVACLVPAIRALHINPVVALRYE